MKHFDRKENNDPNPDEITPMAEIYNMICYLQESEEELSEAQKDTLRILNFCHDMLARGTEAQAQGIQYGHDPVVDFAYAYVNNRSDNRFDIVELFKHLLSRGGCTYADATKVLGKTRIATISDFVTRKQGFSAFSLEKIIKYLLNK